MQETNLPPPTVPAGTAPRRKAARAKLTAAAVSVLAAYAAGPGSDTAAKAVPMSRAAVDRELHSAAAEAGVHEATGFIMGFSFSGGSYRPSAECMITWSADTAPGARAYAAIEAALTRKGWTTLRHKDNEAYANTIFGKDGWSATVSYSLQEATNADTELIFTATAPAC
ncbi:MULTISPECIES: hypothetical protein [unclassified Streptomyces]|uniref:hypothetical protein n=1 Tax=unclassified Streptomyces TaxID=2593676 RepID=UPI0037F3B7C5